MTELYEMYMEKGKETVKAELQELTSGELLQELEDTTQYDMLKMGSEWLCGYEEKAVYELIIIELGERLSRYEKELGIPLNKFEKEFVKMYGKEFKVVFGMEPEEPDI